jgi:nucleoside-diphosphate-sugar epimerase
MQNKEKLINIIEQDSINICKNISLVFLKNKTVLITGASGLLGTYFLETINTFINKTNSKVKVFCIIHGDIPNHLIKFKKRRGFNFIKGDLTDSAFLKKLPKADIILHCAGYGQPRKFLENKIKTLKLNTLSTFFLFEKLKIKGKFLFVSSSELYSGLKNPPYKESLIGSTNTDHPRACYIEGKRCGETICLSYQQIGYDVKIGRLALAYGPGTKINDQRVLNSLIQKGIINKKIVLLDKGEAVRTYCYISDVIEMFWKILIFGKESVYNVGGISKIKIKNLAKKIGKILNVPVIIPTNDNSLIGAPREVSLDLSKIKREFKKNEFVSIEEGIRRTIDWQNKLYLKNRKK